MASYLRFISELSQLLSRGWNLSDGRRWCKFGSLVLHDYSEWQWWWLVWPPLSVWTPPRAGSVQWQKYDKMWTEIYCVIVHIATRYLVILLYKRLSILNCLSVYPLFLSFIWTLNTRHMLTPGQNEWNWDILSNCGYVDHISSFMKDCQAIYASVLLNTKFHWEKKCL